MKKFFVVFISILTLLIFSCDSWMNDDGFYEDIEYEVKVANAPQINVYVRYAMTRQGKTDPDGYDSFKVGIPHEIAATTEPEYGFVRWAAFSTEYLATGDSQSKNKDIYYIDDQDYNTRILPHELSSEEITFENARSPSTTVTINVERNDIYLVPIIAQRPTVSLSIPASGSSGVVRNMSVRINFTKPMDIESFKNAEGVFDKITVTQGIQTFTASGDIEINSEDISDHFEFNESMFSENKKMITIKFNQDSIAEGYASQSSVNIIISKDVRDIYGFTMTDDNAINFSVGSRKDSLAPRITYLSAGTGEHFQSFQGVYKDTGTVENLGQKTKISLEGAASAPLDDIGAAFYNSYILNRIGKDSKLIIRVFAEDLAGAGSGQSLDGIESDVTRVGFRAKHLYNADGTTDTEARMTDIDYKVYLPQQNNTGLSGSYRELVNRANSEMPDGSETLDSSYGSLYEYDLSEMPDGLIQIDVTAVDVVQNIGFFDGGSYSAEYGNAYASLFVVKDTTPPDAEANKDYVQADLSVVPNGRGMFNAEYYRQIAVVQSEAGIIRDAGHARLSTPNAELKWIIVPGSDTSWASSVSSQDSRWKFVTNSYAPAESALPSVDGPVAFTYALMDNLGNISNAVLFNSVTYDNTPPTLGSLAIAGVNGYVSTSIKGNILANQVLSIPVTDATAGLETIDVSIACIKDGVTYDAYATPFASTSLSVKVNDAAAAYTVDGTKLTFETPVTGESVVTIQGLQIADANNVLDDSTYRINVKVKDAALNESVLQTKDIGNDSTAPVINYVKVLNIANGITTGNPAEYWTTESTPQTALYISLTETNTGAKVFNFAGSSIRLRSDTALSWNGTNLPISVDTENNVITITDDSRTIVTNGGEVVIGNVDLTGTNSISLDISDLVTNTSSKTTSFTLTSGTVIPSFKYDAATPVINSVVLTDQAPGAGGTAEAGFTNDEYVQAVLNVTATESGICQITVTGATFDGTTLVNNATASDAANGFAVSADGSTIILKTNSGSSNRLLKSDAAFNITIGNVKLPAGDGDKTVSFTVTSLANRTSQAAGSSIRLDKTAPVWVGDGVFVAASNSADGVTPKATIFPHTSTSASGNVKIGDAVYFYTKDSINVAADVADTNRKNGNVDLYIDGTGPVAEYASVAPGTHTIYAVDKAGNKSAEKTFYVVADTTAPAAFDGYVTFTMPDGGNIYRGNSATVTTQDTTQNYVLKYSTSPYNILVKLPGVTAADVDVGGNARAALGRYAELDSLTGSSPIEYFAFSMGNDPAGLWQAIGTGVISIPLTSDNAAYTPYTIWLKDGCGNISQFTVPVNWSVDGSVMLGGKDLGSTLYPNAAKGITYYKGNTTPVITLTGYTDSCYYPSITTSSSTTETQNYSIRSRVLAWPNNSTTPGQADFYSTSIDSTRFSSWQFLTIQASGQTGSMTHNYPSWVTSYNTTGAYKLFYIIEDKLGNCRIEELVNDSDPSAPALQLWMYDNTPPTITVETAGKVNTIDNINYYSTNSTLSLNMTDTQSGIEWDGNAHYSGSGVLNTLPAVEYSLATISPLSDFTIKINGIKDYVGNIMPDTEGLVFNSQAVWLKQTVPALASTAVSVIDCGGSASGTGGTACGTGNYIANIEDDTATGGKRIKVKAPRSVTSVKFALNVTQQKYDVSGNLTADTTDLLGWRITDSPLSAEDIAATRFYSSSDVGTTITQLSKNASGAYEKTYSKTDTSVAWSGTQYFYAVNRAGLICSDPIVIEFETNPVPQISVDLTQVTTVSGVDVNFLKPASKIKFTSNTPVTKCEYFIGDSATPVLTKDFTASPVTEYELTATENGNDAVGTPVLPRLTSAQSLTVKLYTETEVSVITTYADGKLPLTTTGYASSNLWVYDPTAPIIQRIFVPGIKEGTTNGSTKEYWITSATNKTDLFITVKEENSGINLFNFAGSTISLTSTSNLYKVTSLEDTGTLIAGITVDTSANTLRINGYNDAIRDTTGADVMVKITDVLLVSASSTTASSRPDNKVNLTVTDCSAQDSVPDTTNYKHQRFALDNTTRVLSSYTTQITGFNYDASASSVACNSSYSTYGFLRDRSSVTPDGYTVTPNAQYTNEEYVNAYLSVTSSESGIAQITLSGATFEESGTNASQILQSSTSIPFEISNEGHTATFSNNKIIKGSNVALTLNNIVLPDPDTDGSRTVYVTVTNLGNKTSGSTSCYDSITLDKTPPEWNGVGLYTTQTLSTIYPRSSNGTEKAYGITGVGSGTTANDVFFYSEQGVQFNIYADVTETNKPTYNLRLILDDDSSIVETKSSTSTYSYLDMTIANTANTARFTTFATDLAGNKSTNKTCTLVKDTEAPASVYNYITFKEAMEGGVSVGQVFRGSEAQYAIQKLGTNVEPYKVIIKLNSTTGVAATDKGINGQSVSSRPTTAFSELLKIDPNTINTSFAATSKAPIEYFAVTEGSSPSEPSAWIRIEDSSTHYAGSEDKLTVVGGGSISISLPKTGTCNPITVFLKDGCGHVSSTRVSATANSTYDLSWAIDDKIGLGGSDTGNYSVSFKGTTQAAVAEDTDVTKAHVILHSPYNSSTSGSGGIGVNGSVTYYKKAGSSTAVPKLILQYKDECTIDTGTASATNYSLRGRLIAGNFGTNGPSQEEFLSDDETLITRRWASSWKYAIVPDTATACALEFDFPDNTASSLTGDSSTGAYELWYVVADAVGNKKIMQVKNRISSTSSTDIKNWFYDGDAPTLDTTNDVSFKWVNKDNSNYYYSSGNSKATYTIRDARSGVGTSGNPYITTTDTTIYNMNFTSGRPNVTVYDYIGNSATLDLSDSGTTWNSLSAPTLGSSANASFTRLAGGSSESAETTSSPTGRFYVSSTGSASAGREYTVMAPRVTDSITASLSVNTSASYLLGWVVSDSALASGSAALSAFYSNSTIKPANCTTENSEVTQSENTYTFTKSDTTTPWRSQFTGTKYFYAVNKAGLICQAPVMVTFASNPIPSITGGADTGITYNSIVTGSVNYLKSGNYTGTSIAVDNPSTISFTSDIGLKSAVLKSGSITETKTYSTAATSHNLSFTQSIWSALSAGELKLVLSTATEDSDEFTLSKDSVSSWTYDATRPEFTTALKDSDDDTAAVQNPAGTGTYYVKSPTNSKVKFEWSGASSDIARYEYKTSTGSTWTELVSPYELVVSDTALTYNIRAVDLAGNISAVQNFTVQQDVTAPSGTITPAYTHSGAEDTSKISASTSGNATTVIYNPSYATAVTLTASVTDAGSGLPSAYLSYRTKTDSETDWGASTPVTGDAISATLEADHTYYYEISAKDALGNEAVLHTYTFNGITPSATVTRALKNGTEDASTDYYYVPLNANNTFYYNKNYVNKLAVSISDVTGNTVTLKSQVNDETPVEISDNACAFDLPSSGTDLSATYKIIATDIVGNAKTLATYTVNGNAPEGSIVYDNTDGTGNDPATTKLNTTEDTIFFNQSVENIKLKNGTTVPSGAGGQSVKIYYDKVVAGALSGNPVEITSTYLLPCPGAADGFTATYSILIVDNANNQTVANTYTLKGTAPGGSITAAPLVGSIESDVWTAKTAVAQSEGTYTAGDYALGTETNAETGAITSYLIDYNPTAVNTIKFTPVSVTDCGAGSKIVVKEGTTEISSTAYTDGLEVPVTLGSGTGWTSGKIYDAYVVDNVGNATMLMTYKFRAQGTAPAVQTNSGSFGWSGVEDAYKPTAGVITKTNGYGITAGSENFMKLKNSEGATITGGDYIGIKDTITLSLPIKNSDSLFAADGNKLVSYALSYTYDNSYGDFSAASSQDYSAATNRTTDWTAYQTLSSGSIQIQVNPSDIPCTRTYLFVWLKDILGNTSVYNLANWNETGIRNWWTADTEGPTGSLSWTFKDNSYADLTTDDYDVSAETLEGGVRTIVIQYKSSAKTVILKPVLTDAVSGFDSIKKGAALDRDSLTDTVNNNADNQWNLPTEETVRYFQAKDKLGNTTNWKITYKPVETISRNAFGNWFTNGVRSFFDKVSGGNTYVESERTRSIDLPATEFVFDDDAGSVVKEKVKTAKKKVSKKKSKAKKTAAKKVADTVTAVETVSSAETVATAVEQLEPIPEITEITETVTVDTPVIEQQLQTDTVIDVAAVTEQTLSTIEQQVLAPQTQKTAQPEAKLPSMVESQLQSQSEIEEAEGFDTRMLYADFAILLALVAAIGIFALIKVKKSKKKL